MVELAIRIAAYGSRPQDFFNDGWNVFDFVVIAAAFLPGPARERRPCCGSRACCGSCALVTVLPDLRILVRAMVRSLPPISSLGLLRCC